MSPEIITTHPPGSVQRLAAGSIVVGVLVLGLKFLAYKVTGSVALYSDALESIINVATSVAAFIAIWVSARPADEGHPYGHSKAEYFSTVIEGVLILVAALAILREAWHGMLNPHPLDAPLLGLAINGVATALNCAWGLLLIRRGKASRSPALAADGRHLMTDVYTSGGVLVGVGLVMITRWMVLDSLIAGLVALNILWTGWSLMKESVGGLMDAALPEVDVARVRRRIAESKGAAVEASGLRTRHAGRLTFIDFTLSVPPWMTVASAHQVCDRVEAALLAEFEGASITLHLEPTTSSVGLPLNQ
jgi:cation diffusion facilitator family transporter